MISVKVEEASLARVERKLGDMKRKAPVVISRALNKTATSARVRLAKAAQKAYTVKSGGFKKDMKIEKANSGKLEATIKSAGKPLKLTNFKYSTPPSGARANVVKGNGLKALIKGNIKAFKGSGNLNGQLFQRKTESRYPIKVLSSNSIPKMIGNERRVYGIVKPYIKSDLKKYVDAQIKLLVG